MAKDLDVSSYWIACWHIGKAPMPIEYVQNGLESAMQRCFADFNKFGRDINSTIKYNEEINSC